MAASMVLFLVGFHSRMLSVIVAALIVQGIANGFVRPAMASAGGSALAPEFFGVGMATMRMIALLGSTAGISLEVTMWNIGGFSAVFTMTLIAALLATVAMTFVMPRSRLNSLTPDERRQEEHDRLEEIETDTALTVLPAFEG
jgi:MFS family permease